MSNGFYFFIFSILILAQTGCEKTQPNIADSKPQSNVEQVKTDYPNLKIQAEEIGKATINGDVAKMVDATYPKVVEQFGGKEKMVDYLTKEFSQKKDGLGLQSQIVDEIKQIEKIDNELFAVVPVKLIIKTPEGNVLGESSLVGISNDNGSNWKFIDASNQEDFKTMFPKAAEKIQIPDEPPLKPIRNN